ncbi:MAG TPA: type II toxin-antitoxin system VapC family toxin [Leptospiraceae bacterium]|nr:type II toxin-antitoxin system VapC family toxin [Leptospiraceae bacterium]
MKQNFLLDTDTVSFFLKKDPSVAEKVMLAVQNESELGISIITHYEILSGLKFKFSEKYLKSYSLFADSIYIYPVTEQSVQISSDLYSGLRKKGKPLDDIDLLIAGTAIENRSILVTGNLSHFRRIKGLKTENWRE